MAVDRTPPDIAAIVRVLAEHGVEYVIVGSGAALLRGVDVTPGDLDIVPELSVPNLRRLATALAALDAHPDPDGPFGDWTRGEDGERHWVQREPRPGEAENRLSWTPEPHEPSSFDELLVTRHGSLDVVPEIAGSYPDLARRASRIELDALGPSVAVASVADLLAALTVPRRPKDRDRVAALRRIQRG